MESANIITVNEIVTAITSPEAVVLQSGRNLTVRAKITLRDGTVVDAAIKRFPAPSHARSCFNRLRGVQAKANRSYLAAQHLYRKSPDSTPEPIAFIEAPEGQSPGPSWFISRFEPGLISFKKKLIDLYACSGPCDAIMDLLRVVAENCARIHDAGFMHRDLGNQNIMLSYDPNRGEPRVMLIDLNRSRVFNGPLSTQDRARDLSRINLPSDFLRVFLEMYWRGAIPLDSFLKTERRCRRLYAIHCATRRIRHPFRITPPSPDGEYPNPKALWIWDSRSEQAVSTLRPKDRHRHQSLSRITAPIWAMMRSIVVFNRHRGFLKDLSFERSVLSFAERVFVSISADPARLERELIHLADLGCIGVHVRIYAHESKEVTDSKINAVKRLKSLNYAVTLSLVQNRDVVMHPDKWFDFCDRVLAELHDIVMWVEMLHAVNRVKWGIWSFSELRTMLGVIPQLSVKYRDVSFIGPSVIDFEWDYLAAALRCLPARANLSALSTHLYVDRRGAPEAMQGHFNALGKLQVLGAMAISTKDVHDHLIVSEFNWPLSGTREWSPVGTPYVSPGTRTNDPSVSEEDAAVYTMRYVFIGLCSGLADSMVFWSLASHGFGLVDPGTQDNDTWRERPAFKALKVFFKVFKHGHFTRAILRGENNAWAMQFVSGDGKNIIAAWSSDTSATPPTPAMPFKATKAIDMYGTEIPIPAKLSNEPVYIFDRM